MVSVDDMTRRHGCLDATQGVRASRARLDEAPRPRQGGTVVKPFPIASLSIRFLCPVKSKNVIL